MVLYWWCGSIWGGMLDSNEEGYKCEYGWCLYNFFLVCGFVVG